MAEREKVISAISVTFWCRVVAAKESAIINYPSEMKTSILANHLQPDSLLWQISEANLSNRLLFWLYELKLRFSLHWDS